jgi:hypothetical protein
VPEDDAGGLDGDGDRADAAVAPEDVADGLIFNDTKLFVGGGSFLTVSAFLLVLELLELALELLELALEFLLDAPPDTSAGIPHEHKSDSAIIFKFFSIIHILF